MTSFQAGLRLTTVLSPLLAAALLAGPAPAPAATITQSFRITASGFEEGAPVQPVTGVFSFEYDRAQFRFFPSAAGLTISGFNLEYSGTAKFTYQPNGDVLTVGDTISFNSYSVSPTVAGFGFFLRDPSTAPWISSFAYSTGEGRIWHASVIDVTAVPEPASWALMIAGFGLAGAGLRRRSLGASALA